MSSIEEEMHRTARELGDLQSGAISLRFDKILTGNSERGLAPAYHFKILNEESLQIGHINLRIGESGHVLMTAGHVGFSIEPEYRGFGYAFHACIALAPLVCRHYDHVILTADPDNVASIRTIERLGARFIEEVSVPPGDPGYETGARRKNRYEWIPVSRTH